MALPKHFREKLIYQQGFCRALKLVSAYLIALDRGKFSALVHLTFDAWKEFDDAQEHDMIKFNLEHGE